MSATYLTGTAFRAAIYGSITGTAVLVAWFAATEGGSRALLSLAVLAPFVSFPVTALVALLPGALLVNAFRRQIVASPVKACIAFTLIGACLGTVLYNLPVLTGGRFEWFGLLIGIAYGASTAGFLSWFAGKKFRAAGNTAEAAVSPE